MPYLSLSLIDDYGRTTKRIYELDTQVDLATYTSVVGSFLTHLAAVTDLGVVRADLIIDAFGTGFAVTAGANVDVGGTFTGLIYEGDGDKASLKLPGVKATFVGGDGTIAISGAIATYLGHWEDDGDWNLSDGEKIVTWLSGVLDK